MSSWIPSLFNPPTSTSTSDDDKPTSSTPRSPSSGVKEDLTAVFRGVAAFLAPPPEPTSSSDAISGIKNDLAEIEGSLRSGLSLISSKLNSNFLQFQSQENDGDDDGEDLDRDDEDLAEEEDIAGINEEVVGFVRKISGRPELWTDFPLSSADDYILSDYQKEHAVSIEDLVPELVILEKKICSQISEGKFWLIYFILLFPWLDEEELKLLSTPQVVEARETLLKKLQDKTDVDKGTSENLKSSVIDEDSGKGYSKEGGQSTSHDNYVAAESSNAAQQKNILEETETKRETEIVNKTIPVDAPKQSENEDVSFSDLEDDDNDLPCPNGSKVNKGESRKELQVNERAELDKQKAGRYANLRDKESEGEESNDWLTVNDTDFDSLAEI